MTFNLRATVLDIMSRAESVEYGAVADEVLARLDPSDYRDALAAALPSFVRSVTVAQRTPGAVKPLRQAHISGWKQPAIRDGWQKRLLEVYATADGNKRLGDFTHEDLSFQASICERQAKAKLSKAKGWKALADLLAAEGVARVRDLRAEVLMPTLGAVA